MCDGKIATGWRPIREYCKPGDQSSFMVYFVLCPRLRGGGKAATVKKEAFLKGGLKARIEKAFAERTVKPSFFKPVEDCMMTVEGFLRQGRLNARVAITTLIKHASEEELLKLKAPSSYDFDARMKMYAATLFRTWVQPIVIYMQ